MQPTILITGAYGQLGYALINVLQQSFNIIATDITIPVQHELKTYKMDITDFGSVSDIINQVGPDIIINLAALTNVDKCEEFPDLAQQVNVNGVENLLTHFRGKFIQLSTDYIFDGKNGPYGEDDNPNPINVYGQTKLAAEEIIKNCENPWVICRTNVLFDFYKDTHASFINWVVQSLRQNKTIKVVNDQWNNPIWTFDMATIISIIITDNLLGVYNCGGDKYLNRFEFAKIIAKEFELDDSLILPTNTIKLDQIAPRPFKGGLKNEKITNVIGTIHNSLATSLSKIKHKDIQ
jgi:dTDP-4-dehydrorhamnose reductase